MDAPTSHAVCGDGVLDVATETCDDGNTTSGDGCSSTCQTEVVNKCGNGAIDSGETCDDGNQAGSDGCSAQCTVETGFMCTGAPSVCTMMTSAMGTCASPMVATLALNGTLYTGNGAGDTTTATNQVAAAACDFEQTSPYTGAGPDQIWTFVNPIAQPVLITLHPTTSGYDGVLRLTTTACDVATEVPDDVLPDDLDDDATSDGCADLGASTGAERLNYNNLAAGTYYIVVDGYVAGDFGAYTFDIQAGHGTCGNGTVDFGETCDDHNTATGDGCDDTCHVQAGYTCTGTPSVCTQTCGNGVHDTGETCDDHNTTANDGCSATCQIETGYVCTGTPSVCHQVVCGDGVIEGTEVCDDHNATANDGCSATCQVETGYVCTGTPSVCHHVVCGDGVIDGAETCDDHNTTANDGCSATCQVETGYTCSGTPSTCLFGGTCAMPFPLTLTPSGAGYIGSGASDTTTATNGFAAGACGTEATAGGAPDQTWMFTNPVAQPVVITGTSVTDIVLRLTTTACDITTSVTDTTTGCADLHASGTAEVLNYAMLPAGTYYLTIDAYSSAEKGAYSFTLKAGNTAVCGNGTVDTGETCDDHNTTASDGCSATCQVETGYVCTGTPSVCHQVVCGDGIIDTGETCDDHNATASDGCSATCQVEAGYTCTGTPSTCLFGGTCAMPFPLTLTLVGTAYHASGASDTTTATNGFAAGACDGEASAGAGTDQTWVFTNPVAQPVVITGTSVTDIVLRLTSVACDITHSIPDDATHADGCADLHASGTAEVLNYNMLPAGTYYLTIDAYSSTESGAYSFTLAGGS